MMCPKCKSENVDIQVIEERKKTGLITIIFYILLAISVLGLFVLIPILLRKKTRTVTYVVCKDCGKRWEIKQ